MAIARATNGWVAESRTEEKVAAVIGGFLPMTVATEATTDGPIVIGR